MSRVFHILFVFLVSLSVKSQSFLNEKKIQDTSNSEIEEVLRREVENASSTEEVVISKATLAEFYQKTGVVDKAFYLYKEALILAQEKNEYDLQKRLVLEFTFLYIQTSNFSEGINEQKKLLDNPSIIKSDYEKMLLNSRLGFFLENIGKVTVATGYYFKALNLAEKIEDDENVAKMCNNIGNAYLGVGQPEEARQYIQKGILLMEKNKEFSIPILYNNLAKSYEFVGDTIKALTNYRICIEKARSNNNYEAIITSGINLSKLWIDKNQIDSASVYAEVVKKSAISFNEFSPQMVRSMELQADICKFKGVSACIEKNLVNAYLMAKEIGLIIELERITSNLSQFYIEKGDAESAYRYLKENNEYFDSINVYEAQDLLMMKIEEKKLDSLKFASYKLKTDKELLELKVSNRTIGLWLFVIALFSLFVIVLLYVRNVKKKRLILKLELQQKEETISTKNREILSANLEIEAQEKALNDVRKKLNDQLSTEYDSEFNELNLVLKQTDRSLSKLDRRKYVDNLIKLSDNEFHNHLTENHPDLTSGEIKLATLIRLNLGTEELLDIFNISRESLNKKRYRIRRKFNLKKEEDLDNFIRSL